MDLKLSDFTYQLPEEKIAKHPLKDRSTSKLLVYNQSNISHHEFKDIADLLPSDSLLVFNNTKVIPARIIMYKASGARIEIFLLEPLLPSHVHEEVMNTTAQCTWKCMIGNAKKWKISSSLELNEIGLSATRVSENEVTFNWSSSDSFAAILNKAGKIPLPPYINREVEQSDQERYQTVYSRFEGAVAAPTAGLHFTDDIIKSTVNKGIETCYLTLHVSAGTFQPIKHEEVEKHPMHNEQVWLDKDTIEKILRMKRVVAVGTTSMRTLESLYWYGVKILSGDTDFFISQNDPYELKPVSKTDALKAILDHMEANNLLRIGGQTEIFIYPGYTFKICNGLITNYHLPGSTLILLVAAFIGSDWKKVYDSALHHNYRFLSYGDSSLLMV